MARDGAQLAAWAAEAGSVLELACGTGAVAAFLARQPGIGAVAASDLSPAMIEHARHAYADAAVTWSVGDLRAPPAGAHDRLLVLGNSLNLLPDRTAVRAALAAMRGACAPGGELLLQIINPDAPAYREPRLVQRTGIADGRPLLAAKSLVPGPVGRLLTISWWHGSAIGAEAMSLLDLRVDDLVEALATAGWQRWSLHGDLGGGRWDAAASADLVVRARR